MIKRGGGSIVNVASLQGMFGWPRYAAYAASKAGIIGLTRQIAVDYAGHDPLNAISPGAMRHSLGRIVTAWSPPWPATPSRSPLESDGGQAAPSPSVRLRGPGRPGDVAYAALYLVSDEAAHISGHNLVVDGGASARLE